jgi:hypothetical protein
VRDPKTLEEMNVTPQEIPIKKGLLHMHFVRERNGRFEWAVRKRRVAGLCGTQRCIVLEVKQLSGPRCKHTWGPTKGIPMKCSKCGELGEFSSVL